MFFRCTDMYRTNIEFLKTRFIQQTYVNIWKTKTKKYIPPYVYVYIYIYFFFVARPAARMSGPLRAHKTVCVQQCQRYPN